MNWCTNILLSTQPYYHYEMEVDYTKVDDPINLQ